MIGGLQSTARRQLRSPRALRLETSQPTALYQRRPQAKIKATEVKTIRSVKAKRRIKA